MLRVAREAVAACRPLGATLIVNDRAEVAAAADADGVHVGQLDADGTSVRRAIGPDRILGRSTHSPDALRTARAHADYVAFGPVFPTERLSWAKPLQGLERLAEARLHAGDHPLVAIGGIDAARLPAVRAAGVDSWAVIGAVADADDPVAATARLLGPA
jgi:thiamine-phosphate pyrophosphorylase